ncbi:hypothetical protein EVA_14674 [gut metagenome]|uniref:Uncharacterized protein n=1 Tax=gut metagenome TaxID=749906 RepID=J9CBB7_9ZZZZ
MFLLILSNFSLDFDSKLTPFKFSIIKLNDQLFMFFLLL